MGAAEDIAAIVANPGAFDRTEKTIRLGGSSPPSVATFDIFFLT
jgi:hypothetical protein